MRFDGKLDKWNDDRGFGFIAPTRGGEPVFVHISAFPYDGRRPQVGDALTFEVEAAGEGKKRAINVQRGGLRAETPERVRATSPKRTGGSAGRRETRRHSVVGAVVTTLVLVVLGGYTYNRFAARVSAAAPLSSNSPTTSSEPAGASRYRCDGRIHCSQMTSCEEAKFFLQNCPGTRMDGDRDGIPCEKQWCTGRFGR